MCSAIVMDVNMEIREKVARHHRCAPLLADCTTDEGPDSKEEQEPQKCKQTAITSSKVHTADSTIVKHITSLHELVMQWAFSLWCMRNYRFFYLCWDTWPFYRQWRTPRRIPCSNTSGTWCQMQRFMGGSWSKFSCCVTPATGEW